MEEDQLDDLELEVPITLKILDGIASDFTQAKWWRWWKTVKCGGLIVHYNLSRDGVPEDVFGFENTFWSPWPWHRSSSSWPWSLQTHEKFLSSAKAVLRNLFKFAAHLLNLLNSAAHRNKHVRENTKNAHNNMNLFVYVNNKFAENSKKNPEDLFLWRSFRESYKFVVSQIGDAFFFC